ncbi:hypothetical protein PGN35_007130 [Nodosilinea sp. PGN35]|uniref:hypothetical protein n=1 Tax=Nodosilinea sp. PGN35 TaxID=3020489 RepID=UPI0023B24EA7|nr:hypothetical protein [Nodosilinea sp. TSF1-S3]MDF0365924.1 hypothetical protein [Nodosilinea sp. TSF1-S3]
MKQFSQVIGGLVVLGLAAGCTPNLPPGGSGATDGADIPNGAIAPTIDEFDFDEIAGRGCGMSLRRAERSPQDRQYVLFNGLVQHSLSEFDVSMEMKIDDQVVVFSRTDYEGEQFSVENYPWQRFVSEDGSLVATVEVEALPPTAPPAGVPSSGESAVVIISRGTVTVERDGQTDSVSVVGDAGC